ncbi:hypothetical protein EDB80DRAFT_882015 [Ilyonectria destructans]|nr:hypothetical protein EDB80DRAFT_882015 [Ilyonectria destructans]
MRFRVPQPFADKPVVEEEKTPQDVENSTANDKETGVTAKERDSSIERGDSDADFQRGDEAIRAMTQIWTKRDLIIAYVLPSPLESSEAIIHAYADTQRLMLITATCLYAITLFSVLMRKDVNVKEIEQVKGVVWELQDIII